MHARPHYDSTDRLDEVKQGITTVAAYLHNAEGQRVAKTVGVTTTHYIYDLGGNLITEHDGATGAVQAEYVALEGNPLAYISTSGIYWIHADHLGTPQVLTDAARAVVWDANYTPFGEATVTGALTFNQRFPGQYADAETGLHYNYFRDYDATTGRYIQSDPIGLRGGLNTYGYVGGNPVMRVDPRGLEGNACGGEWVKIREEFLTGLGGHSFAREKDETGAIYRYGDCECVWECDWCVYKPREATTSGRARHPYFDFNKSWPDGDPGPCNCPPPGPSLLSPCGRISCLGLPEKFS